MTLTVLVADDEPLAREGVINLLAALKDVQVVGEAVDGADAVALISELTPDLVFLDVQMPELDGFGVVEAMGGEMPATVFVTAYDEFAIKAFDVHAVDYLLKPIERERFSEALERARKRIGDGPQSSEAHRLAQLLEEVQRRRRDFTRILVKDGGKIRVVRSEELRWIEAAGNYVRLHLESAQILVRQTMAALERRLDPDRFVRIHRSTIVSVDHITEIKPRDNGDSVVTISGGKKLTLSRSYRAVLQGRLGGTI